MLAEKEKDKNTLIHYILVWINEYMQMNWDNLSDNIFWYFIFGKKALFYKFLYGKGKNMLPYIRSNYTRLY